MTELTETQQIKEICTQAGLTVDSIDGDKGLYTVTYISRSFIEMDARLIARVQAIERKETACYTVRAAGRGDEPLERLTFQRRAS